MLSQKIIEDEISRVEAALWDKSNWRRMALEPEDRKALRREAMLNVPGVYAVFCDGQIVYIGESGNLAGRLRDMHDTRNHCIRRHIGERHFSGEQGYIAGNSRQKFPLEIEEKITEHCRQLYVSPVPVYFGRTEIEERLIAQQKHKLAEDENVIFYNAKVARKPFLSKA